MNIGKKETSIVYRKILTSSENRNGRIFPASLLEKIAQDFFEDTEKTFLCAEVTDDERYRDIIDLTKVLHVVRDIMFEDNQLILGLEPINAKAIRMLDSERTLRENNIESAIIFTPMMTNVKIVDNVIINGDVYGYSIDFDSRILKNLLKAPHIS